MKVLLISPNSSNVISDTVPVLCPFLEIESPLSFTVNLYLLPKLHVLDISYKSKYIPKLLCFE